jgi:hypothetical protein
MHLMEQEGVEPGPKVDYKQDLTKPGEIGALLYMSCSDLFRKRRR